MDPGDFILGCVSPVTCQPTTHISLCLSVYLPQIKVPCLQHNESASLLGGAGNLGVQRQARQAGTLGRLITVYPVITQLSWAPGASHPPPETVGSPGTILSWGQQRA